MMKWFKRDHAKVKDDVSVSESDTTVIEPDAENRTVDLVVTPVHDGGDASHPIGTIPATDRHAGGLLSKIVRGLSKTRHQLGDGLGRLLLGKKEIDQAILDEVETILLRADCGIEATERIVMQLTKRLERKQLSDGQSVLTALQSALCEILTQATPESISSHPIDAPMVILMVGVNGAGKTTTIGKLAKWYQGQGKKVMLAAGDTFRAAAVEQLQVWGARNNIPVIAQQTGSDSASVLFDALSSAKARHIDVLIADTAGRLHTQHHLMDELKKIKRVMQKLDPSAPHETMLVLDASIGQNALNQAREFHQAVGVSSITVTKLDGTAKGGIVFAIANELGIPFRYMGVGEGIDDLQPFDATAFVDAILHDDHI